MVCHICSHKEPSGRRSSTSWRRTKSSVVSPPRASLPSSDPVGGRKHSSSSPSTGARSLSACRLATYPTRCGKSSQSPGAAFIVGATATRRPSAALRPGAIDAHNTTKPRTAPQTTFTALPAVAAMPPRTANAPSGDEGIYPHRQRKASPSRGASGRGEGARVPVTHPTPPARRAAPQARGPRPVSADGDAFPHYAADSPPPPTAASPLQHGL